MIPSVIECLACGCTKHPEQFGADRRTKTGRASKCRACARAVRDAYYAHLPEAEARRAEMVVHPAHYRFTIEPIDAIESWKLGFCLGNAVKYIARAEHKGKPSEDIRKAIWYLERELMLRAKGG